MGRRPFDASKASSPLGGAIDGVLSEYVVLEEGGAVKSHLEQRLVDTD